MNQKHFNQTSAYRFKRFVRKAYSAFNSMHKVVSIGVVSGCILTFAHSTAVQAQSQADIQQHPESLEKELEEVMVTASRVEMPMAQTPKPVTVITKKQIELAPVRSLQELLIYIAGVDVIQRGGHGVQADIALRGGTADQTAVLLNGINLTNSQTGHYSFDIPINLSDIERIEIVTGPSTLIYGSGAFSGGINIITKKDIAEKIYARFGAGMHSLYEGEARGAVKAGITTNSLSFGYNTSDGYIANSDYDIYNAMWQTRLHLPKSSKIDFLLGYNNKRYGANTFYSPKFPNQYEKTDAYLGSLKADFGTKLKIMPSLYWNRHHDQFDLTKNSAKGRNYHRNDMYGANLNLQYNWKYGITNLGGELRHEEILSSKMGKPMTEKHGAYYTNYDNRTNASLAFEHNIVINRISASAGVLMNHNTLQDGKYKFYPTVSMAYRPIESVKLTGSWSMANRMPTFTDLWYTQETHNGNSGLEPERSQSVEIGMQYRNALFSAYINGFLLWGRNMIDWVRVDVNEKWQSWNHTKLNKHGFDLGATLNLSQIDNFFGQHSVLSIDYSRIHQNRNDIDLESKYSLNYLRDKLTARLHHDIYKGISMDWGFRFQKRMGYYFTEKEKRDYPAFSTLDLKINYKYRDFDFNVAMNNLYDTHYYDIESIPQAGFWLMGGISYTLK